jgi:hypothetical protein
MALERQQEPFHCCLVLHHDLAVIRIASHKNIRP